MTKSFLSLVGPTSRGPVSCHGDPYNFHLGPREELQEAAVHPEVRREGEEEAAHAQQSVKPSNLTPQKLPNQQSDCQSAEPARE